MSPISFLSRLALVLLWLVPAGVAPAGDRERTADLAARVAAEVARADSLAARGEDAALAATTGRWLESAGDAPELVWPLLQRRGLALLRLGRHEEAVEALERVALWAPEVPANHRNLALALMALGRRGRAFGEYREALDLDPADDAIRAEYAHVLLDFGQTGQALAVLRAERGRDGRSPALDRAEARAHLAAGDPAAALPALERLHAAAPDDAQLREQLALARLRTERPAEARSLLLTDWPQGLGPTGRRLVLEADRLLGDGGRALALAAAVTPAQVAADPDLLALAALICYDLGEDEAGLELVDRVIAVVPDRAAYRNNRVAFLLRLGRREEADAEWARVLELDPSLADNRTETPAPR